MKRLLIPSAAMLWGLQFAFLTPALALILVTLFDATAGEVGWVLAIYNTSGFFATLILPAYADRRGDYLRPMLGCGLLTLALAVVLAATSSLPIAVIALVVFGAPAGVGVTLLFAYLRHSGARPADIVNTRALVSLAWVAGPPLATLIIGVFGNLAIIVAIATVAVLNTAVTALLLTQSSARPVPAAGSPRPADDEISMSRLGVSLVVGGFILLQATNSVVVSIMSLFVTQDLGLDILWAGVALGVAAGLEVPALLLIGRLSRRYSSLGLVSTGCLAGIAYYLAMYNVTGPGLLVGIQVLNAWFVAAISGVGLALFQQLIRRPGLASGLFANTRRVGAIASGPIIGFGAKSPFGYGGIFATCAVLTVIAMVATGIAKRFITPPGTSGDTLLAQG
jgi:SET family sugar efflux transporter-like MFS transporter